MHGQGGNLGNLIFYKIKPRDVIIDQDVLN